MWPLLGQSCLVYSPRLKNQIYESNINISNIYYVINNKIHKHKRKHKSQTQLSYL